MMMNSSSNKAARVKHSGRAAAAAGDCAAGFTLLETVVAMCLLSAGLLALAASITYSLTSAQRSQNLTKAKQMVITQNEQVQSLRDTGRLDFEQISNGATDGFSGFSSEFIPVTADPGADGISGSVDDVADEQDEENKGFERKIVITPINDNVKKVEVTVKFPGLQGYTPEISGAGYVNNDARENFRR